MKSRNISVAALLTILPFALPAAEVLLSNVIVLSPERLQPLKNQFVLIRDERIAIPIGSHHARYGVTLSLPSVVGRQGVIAVIEPDASEEERRALERSADTLRQAQRDRALS